jgi:hypothetical protein
MAGKTINAVNQSLNHDDEHNIRSKSQMLSFQQMLITRYRQWTLPIFIHKYACGAAKTRPTLKIFRGQEATTLIPKSNPFFTKIIQDIAGYDLDALWLVNGTIYHIPC